MRRFNWPLQRLLDVTTQRERTLRSKLFMLLQRITHLHQEIIRRNAVLRSSLADLAEQSIEERIARQRIFMRWSASVTREIRVLRSHVKDLGASRAETMAQLVKARKSKETLRRLRTEAEQEHVRGELRLEQKRFDEVAQTAFSRRLAHRKVLDAT